MRQMSSEAPSPPMRGFPRYLLSFCVLLNLVALVFISWRLSDSSRKLSDAHQNHEEALMLRGEILRIDELLTMSCWVAATTGKAYWISRYNDHVPILEAKLEALLRLTPGGSAAYVRETSEANHELVALELEALELAQRSSLPEAIHLLESERYRLLKDQYRQGMQRFGAAISADLVSHIESARAEISWGERLTLFTLAFLLFCWCLTLWIIRSWRRLLEGFHGAMVNAERRLQRLLDERTKDLAARTRETERQGSQIERLLHSLLRTEQQERARLGRLMHDELQQLLVSARMRAAISRDQARFDKADLVEVIDRLDEAIESARDLTTRLHPLSNEEAELVEILKKLIVQMNQRYRFTTFLQLDVPLPPLRAEVLLLVYGIVRELLFNVVKHAGVSEAKVEAQQKGELLQLSVQDKGRGFDVQLLDIEAQASGLGLSGMRERLAMIGGTLKVFSEPMGGTTVSFEIPNAYVRKPHSGSSEERASQSSLDALENAPISIFIADDNEPLRRSLRELFESDERFTVVGEAGSGPETVSQVLSSWPELVLMDFSMPGFDGAEATKRIKEERDELVIVGFSSFDSNEVIEQMQGAGARCVLPKNREPSQLLEQLFEFTRR